MPNPGPLQRTERVASASRRPAFVGAALVAALTILAVLKPWNSGVPPPAALVRPIPSPTAAVPAAVTARAPTPVPDATIDPLVMRKQCQNPDLWRLITLERSGNLQGRSLLPVTLVAASGPADPRIVAQGLHTGQLLALGYCVPTALHADVVSTERQVRIWQVVEGRGPQPIDDARVADPALATVGEVYLEPLPAAPAGAPTASNPTWPEGRYVFETPPNLPGGTPGWFAFQFASTAVAQLDAP